MNQLPLYLNILFILTTIATIWFFYKATNKSLLVLVVCLLWLALQAGIALTGFYTITNTIPPRIALVIGPPLIFILLMFMSKKGRIFIQRMDHRLLTYMHIVRVPVEIVLFILFTHHLIPRSMTFEGYNFDIISGISAPIVAFFLYKYKKIMLVWNFVCLVLLINIVTIAILSAPSVFQQFAMHQPNIGVFIFPFIWLPCFIVPVVLISHLASIQTFFSNKKKESQ